MKYIIITPAKNEEDFIENTIKSVLNQTILPRRWVIVDDGSEDKTKILAEKYSKNHPWIQVISSNKTEKRQEGAKIIQAFYIGYKLVETDEWDIIVKLDADLTLPHDYFEAVINSFNKYPKIGLCGGYCAELKDGEWKKINHASYHIRGALKAVRRECWVEIGGFQEVMGWDGLDEMSALYLGWETKNISKLVLHHRPVASSYLPKKIAFTAGFYKYKNGGRLLLAFLSALKRIKKRPYLVFSAWYLFGFFSALRKREPKNVTPELAQFINSFHLRRIIG